MIEMWFCAGGEVATATLQSCGPRHVSSWLNRWWKLD